MNLVRFTFLLIIVMSAHIQRAHAEAASNISRVARSTSSVVVTTIQTSINRVQQSPSTPARASFHEPCRLTRECNFPLTCRAGWCTQTDRFDRNEAGESCSGDISGGPECISGLCRNQQCAATAANGADNGAACDMPSQCRSHVCRQNMCAPTAGFPGLPGATCALNSDCASNLCDNGSCTYSGSRANACAPLHWTVSMPSECCSKSAVNNTCTPMPVPQCTSQGQCANVVGTICAGPGDTAASDDRCCSGRRIAGACANSLSAIQPCGSDNTCSSGFCNVKTGTCQNSNGMIRDPWAPSGYIR